MKRKMYKLLQQLVQFLYLELYLALVPVYILADAFGYKVPTGLFVTMVICGVLTILKFLNICRLEIRKEGLKKWLF